jgi:hypothetical protein
MLLGESGGTLMRKVTCSPGRTGLVLIDTVNDIFSERGKGYPAFAQEFERIGC